MYKFISHIFLIGLFISCSDPTTPKSIRKDSTLDSNNDANVQKLENQDEIDSDSKQIEDEKTTVDTNNSQSSESEKTEVMVVENVTADEKESVKEQIQEQKPTIVNYPRSELQTVYETLYVEFGLGIPYMLYSSKIISIEDRSKSKYSFSLFRSNSNEGVIPLWECRGFITKMENCGTLDSTPKFLGYIFEKENGKDRQSLVTCQSTVRKSLVFYLDEKETIGNGYCTDDSIILGYLGGAPIPAD